MSTQTPAGWYPDPERPSQQRYWDGQQWTDNFAPGGPQVQPGPPPKSSGRGKLIVGGLALALLGGCAVFALSGNGDSTSSSSSSGSTSTQQDSTDTSSDSRCVKVPRSVLKEIGSPGMSLTDGWSVRSDDYKKVWFVAARHVNTYPVFSVNGDPSSPDTAFAGLMFSINDDARDFFPYPYGPDTAAQVSMDADGAREAELCALEGKAS